MSTKDRSEKLASGRKMLKKFQSRNAQKYSSSQPTLPSDGLLQPVTAALIPAEPSTYWLSLTTPTALPTSVSNGHTIGSGWGLLRRPLTPTEPLTDAGLTTSSTSGSVADGSHTPSHEQESYIFYQAGQGDGSQSVAGLEQQVQTHAQTIGILVSEKASLQAELGSLQTQLRNKTREAKDLAGHLKVTRQRLEENEREKICLSEEKAHLERAVTRLSSRGDETETAVQRLRTELDDTRQENTELISRVTSQAAELLSLSNGNTELQSKLNMAELLAQQLSAESPLHSEPSANLTNQLDELREEVERLEGVVRSVDVERDQALSDIDALRDAMMQQQLDATGKLSELHSRLVESEAERVCLSEQLQDTRQNEDNLIQSVSTEHAQLQHSTQVAMETLQQERDELQRQLQSQLQETRRLTQLSEQQGLRAVEAERELDRLREAAVDAQGLLDTVARDKEALSRAVGQNRTVKSQLVELQDAFVRMSEQNMQLATELETERFNVAQLQRQASEGEKERSTAEERRREARVEASTQTEAAEETEDVGEGLWMVGGEADQPRLTELLQTAEEERDQLHQQLQALSEVEDALRQERDGLRQEMLQLQSERTEVSTTDHHGSSDRPPSANEGSSPHHEGSSGPFPDTAVGNETLDLLSSLQANFNALQKRHVAVMADKAELVEQLEQRELTIGKLAGETETIGEYVALYQSQREALRAKFKEKDSFIQRLISEKEAVQAQLRKVQHLMRQILSERPSLTSDVTTHHHSSPPPLPSAPSSLPIHLRQLTYHHHHPHSPTPSPPPPTGTVSGPAEQIIQLLAVMGDEDVSSVDVMVPCACCTGEVIIV